ncbi:hypothetical protein R5R35_009563 [Gryllus longicercus]|uniref:J domain-containing protein n=1 Tax=Gryllus longicercus TaxID=2509291 RepID=A0AAN9VUC2_9ORTH
MGIDYYGVLSLKRTCSSHDVKRAFRRLILQFNPKRQYDSSVQVIFQTIAEAYDVLSDPFRRAVYDQYGEEGLKRGVPGPESYIQPYVFHGDPMRTFREFFGCADPFPDLLEALITPKPVYKLPSGERDFKTKEPPLIRPLLLTLHEVYHGGVKKLKINRLELTGKNSNNTEMREKVLSVPIQPGIPSGTTITFPEEGDQGPTIIPADVIFITEERPHEHFQREGNNLVMHCTIGLKDALSGLRVVVKTLDERTFHVNITDVVHPLYEKIIKGEGMPLVQDPRKKGDLIIRFEVEFPKYLPKAAKLLILEAWRSATLEKEGEPDQIFKLVMLDKMKKISETFPKLT